MRKLWTHRELQASVAAVLFFDVHHFVGRLQRRAVPADVGGQGAQFEAAERGHRLVLRVAGVRGADVRAGGTAYADARGSRGHAEKTGRGEEHVPVQGAVQGKLGQ